MSKLMEAWGGSPPPILYLAMPFPDSPNLQLSGGGTAHMSIDAFLADLQRDLDRQQGHYFTYVMDSDKEEADTYTLSEWEVVGSTQCHKAVVLLYYSAVDPYQTVLKYMPDLAEEYMAEKYIGLTVEEFKARYKKEWRIERVDGDPCNLDASLDPQRANLTIVNGRITIIEFW